MASLAPSLLDRIMVSLSQGTHPGAAFGTQSPVEEAERPRNGLDDFVTNSLKSAASLPKRAIENSQTALDTGTYNPAPPLEAAMATMGGTAFSAPKGAMGAGPTGIRAFHGTPHDFDKFSLAKIGTGEGAQSYGHGLYFAGNENVARSYRNALSPSDFDPVATAHTLLESKLVNPADRKFAQSLMNDRLNSGYTDSIPDLVDYWSRVQRHQYANKDDVIRAMRAVDDELPVLHSQSNTGKMYEVNIDADPAKLINYDLPLRDQPQLRKPLEDSGLPITSQLWDKLRGSDVAPRGPNIARNMSDAGVPGIKYLDGLSRRAGSGDHNYVIFNDKIIDILRKYGVGSIAALPPAVQYAISQQGQDE